MANTDSVSALYATLDGRARPEDVADLILTTWPDLDGPERPLLETAAAQSWRRRWPGYSSMSDQFARPIGAERQLATLAGLFGAHPANAYDPADLRRVAQMAGHDIRWDLGELDFKTDRLNRTDRRLAGLDLSRRQYNKRFRFLTRLAAKIGRMEVELHKRRLLLVGRSGLAADITLDSFRADPAAARFVAWYVARRNLRREFTLASRVNPYDACADALFNRCLTDPHTNWWMISRGYAPPAVVGRLSDQEQGELLGRWAALMRGAAELLEQVWDPQVNRRTMIVRRGMDSSTWNTIAQAYNTARSGWLNALAATGALALLDAACPGKAMRLMAADLAAWHRSSGSDVDPDTAVWAALPLPWEVLSGAATCTRQTVAETCKAYQVDPIARGWTAPRAAGAVATFEPTPELVHGVSICDPVWASLLRRAGAFSGKKIRAGYGDVSVPGGVVTSDLPMQPPTG